MDAPPRRWGHTMEPIGHGDPEVIPESPAETIAKIVADMRARRVIQEGEVPASEVRRILAPVDFAPVVDVTAVYHDILRRSPFHFDLHEDVLAAPPWNAAAFSWRNEFGNGIVLLACVLPTAEVETWETDRPVDWNRVKWVYGVSAWAGGWGGPGHGKPVERIRTGGPLHAWSLAVYSDGHVADMRWHQLVKALPWETWKLPAIVLLQSLNFLNCRNVKAVEPQRPRPERRRLTKLGVRVSTINVFPVGRSYPTRGGPADLSGVPLHTVRGSFHHYGPEYGKGLLFGRIAGRFFVPQHVRGVSTLGEVISDYRVHPEGSGPA